ncbi:hypothetical protein RRG08_045630, partial [Elysia crispata]
SSVLLAVTSSKGTCLCTAPELPLRPKKLNQQAMSNTIALSYTITINMSDNFSQPPLSYTIAIKMSSVTALNLRYHTPLPSRSLTPLLSSSTKIHYCHKNV